MTTIRRKLAVEVFGSNKALAAQDATRRKLLAHWGRHPWNWITGVDSDGTPLIHTRAGKDEAAPILPYPTDKDYLRWYVELLYKHRFVLVDKSRQVIASTTTLLVLDWFCRFRPEFQVFLTRGAESEAIALLTDKVRHVMARLPQWVQAELPSSVHPADRIDYPRTRSYIRAVAQNVAVSAARGPTTSAVFIDEAPLQDAYSEIVASVLPQGTRIVAVGTPWLESKGSKAFKAGIDAGLTDPYYRKPIFEAEGFTIRYTPAGAAVVRIGYNADPAKRDPKWLDEEREKYPEERQFRREILGEWNVAAGDPFYTEFSTEKHVRPVSTFRSDLPILRGWDFGIRYSACVWVQYDPATSQVTVLRELMIQGASTYSLRDVVRFLSGQVVFDNLSPKAQDYVARLGGRRWFPSSLVEPLNFQDWSSYEASQRRAEIADSTDAQTSAQILELTGIYLQMHYGAHRSAGHILRALMLPRTGAPGMVMSDACPTLIAGLAGGIVYATATKDNPNPDRPRKDGFYEHLHEALLYTLPSAVGLRLDSALGDGERKALTPPQEANFDIYETRPTASEGFWGEGWI